jgi:hypothetical protein
MARQGPHQTAVKSMTTWGAKKLTKPKISSSVQLYHQRIT